MEMHGVAGAPMNVPRIRKKIPKPFARPSITIGAGAAIKREWRETPIKLVRRGDTVASCGEVDTIEYTETSWLAEDDAAHMIVITNVLGGRFTFNASQSVLAFTARR